MRAIMRSFMDQYPQAQGDDFSQKESAIVSTFSSSDHAMLRIVMLRRSTFAATETPLRSHVFANSRPDPHPPSPLTRPRSAPCCVFLACGFRSKCSTAHHASVNVELAHTFRRAG